MLVETGISALNGMQVGVTVTAISLCVLLCPRIADGLEVGDNSRGYRSRTETLGAVPPIHWGSGARIPFPIMGWVIWLLTGAKFTAFYRRET